jgi:hypothetical protein
MAEMMMDESVSINEEMGGDASQAMMQPDDDIRIVVMSRLESLTPDELRKLDSLIDGESARILMKILPELEDVINMVASQVQQQPQMGALAQM